jgi:hypothetical protein
MQRRDGRDNYLDAHRRNKTPPMRPEWTILELEAPPPGFEPGIEVLQTVQGLLS